jgi:uncharacterized membrane protein YeiB
MTSSLTAPPSEIEGSSIEPPPEVPAKKRRVTGLDLARSIALLGMLYAHFGSSAVGSATGWQHQVTAFTNGRAMPLFVVLSGCGLTYLLKRSKHPWREMLGRSVLLLLIGLSFELTQGVAVILQSYAAYFLLAVPFRKVATKWLLPAAGAFVVAGTLTSMFLNSHLPSAYALISENASTTGQLNILAHPWMLFCNLFFNGVYPVFPSFAFVLLGMWITRHDLSMFRFRGRLIAVGALCAIVGYGAGFVTEDQRSVEGLSPIDEVFVLAEEAGIDVNDYLDSQAAQAGKSRQQAIAIVAKQFGVDPAEFAAAVDGLGANQAVNDAADPTGWDLLNEDGHSNMPAWMLGASGLASFVIGLSLIIADRARRLSKPFVALGQMALTAYVFHLALFRWPMKNWPWGFNPTEGLALTLAGWLAAAAIALAWKSRIQNGPLEYLLRFVGRLTSGDLRRTTTLPATESVAAHGD